MEQPAIPAGRWRQRFDEYLVAGSPRRVTEALDRLREQRVRGNLGRLLAQDETDRQARAAGELTRRGVGLVAERVRGLEYTVARGRTDRHVLALIQHERNRGSRNTRQSSDVGARRPAASHSSPP